MRSCCRVYPRWSPALRHQATGVLYEHLQSTGQCQVSIWPLVAVVYTHGSYSNQCWGNTPTKTGFPSTKWTIESGECWRHHFKGHIMICQAVWSSAVPQLNAEIWTVARAYKESLFVEPSSPLCHVDVHGSQMPLNAMAIRNEVDLRWLKLCIWRQCCERTFWWFLMNTHIYIYIYTI